MKFQEETAPEHSAKAEEDIRAEARLFGKSGKQLTKYRQQMNAIAGDLCVKNPSLLGNKGELLKSARAVLHDSGYVYVKGKSRSKVLNPIASIEDDHSKREKINTEERQHRMKVLKLKSKRNDVEVSLRALKRKQKRSDQYFEKKSVVPSEQIECEEVNDLTDSDSEHFL